MSRRTSARRCRAGLGRRCPRWRGPPTAPTPMPANTPSAAATTEYAVPSKPNTPTRCRRVKPKRTQCPQLGLPLLREHDERVDEEQHPGDDGEAADQSEQPREVVTLPVGELERLLLLVGDLDGTEPGRADLQFEHDGVTRSGAVEDTAVVRDEHLTLRRHRPERRGLRPSPRACRARRTRSVPGWRSQGGSRRHRGGARCCARSTRGSARKRTGRSGRRGRRGARRRDRRRSTASSPVGVGPASASPVSAGHRRTRGRHRSRAPARTRSALRDAPSGSFSAS